MPQIVIQADNELATGQPPLAASVLAAKMASDRLQVELTVMLAAYTAGTGASITIADNRIVNVISEKTGLGRDIAALHVLQQLDKVCAPKRQALLEFV